MRLLQVRARQTQPRSNHTDSSVCAHSAADQEERDNYYASVANVVNNDVDNEHMESCFVKKVESKDLSIFSYLD